MQNKFAISAMLLLALLSQPLFADRTTPWVEGTKVGDTVTARAWVIALNDEQTAYGVLVTTDTMQYILIPATADKNIITPDVLGRWATVKAKVTQRKDANNVTVQILEVTLTKPDPKSVK
jgi:hypothetical protein